MSHYLHPKSICSHLDSLFIHFRWSFKDDKRHNWTPKYWSSICLPKDAGGLGIRLIRSVNRALILILAWNVLSDSTKPWFVALKTKYLDSKFIWKVA